ncbi:5193_t:CDS:1 [Funneliformis geosporum]|uniref:18688_t:CDS:1 n=1 Tax=Funneliformis geosporum TaxID=1117311 RepID=A0A9W4SGU2_9GLOM|nr:5193_t:CDS:1 [Funneliformis geosporum]CAI2169161.1 18688_t:CDS:1 [Funneliformis geosporum]
MVNYIKKFYFIEPKTPKAINDKKKKRTPNMFILYRKEMMKYKPYNMQMTKYSKLVSEKWKELSEVEKNELQRRYQIKRDQKMVNEYDNGESPINYPLSLLEGKNNAKHDMNWVKSNADQNSNQITTDKTKPHKLFSL